MTQTIPFGSRSTADHVLAGVDLSGRHIVVTGCNSGTGFETMSALAANGAHVIGMASTHDAAAAACLRGGVSCTPLACDLADFDSIARAVATLRVVEAPLDAVVANAEIAPLPELRTRYGIEMQFLVNYVGHFALLNQLIGSLRSGAGRIVVVSAEASIKAAPAGGILLDNLDGRQGYDPGAFHGQSKLALAIYAKELSRRLLARGIAVNTANPGNSRSAGLDGRPGPTARFWGRLRQLFMKDARQGAATPSLLAASPRATGITGEYWADCQVGRGSPWLEDQRLGARLWEISQRIVESHSTSLPRALQVAA